jgi:hypothetical protein
MKAATARTAAIADKDFFLMCSHPFLEVVEMKTRAKNLSVAESRLSTVFLTEPQNHPRKNETCFDFGKKKKTARLERN